ncbi:MAG TPA: ABC transporter permease subunit [Solirubrobacteraceae bacterium]|jgi:phosphate transport system permease protein|nr:ABC transporter permease subunit [Solirubrobacteraceae bacterium]
MASVAQPPTPIAGKGRDSVRSWPLGDQIAYGVSWGTGLLLCVIAGAIVLFMLFKGLSYLRLSLLFSSPSPSLDQSQSGGFLDPIEGTLLLTTIGTLIAAPIGISIGSWLSEHARPRWLARMVESGVEMIAGVPSIVLAIFAILVFSKPVFAFLSETSSGGSVFARSFINAGLMMSLIALPLIVGATREALNQVPAHVREASYALGHTKATTLRRVLLPASRPGIATGIVLGMGRIIGDTAIVLIVLGQTARLEPAGGTPVLSLLRGTGSTLTSYVYENSPAGEGHAPQKAYAAAFVLLMMVLAINAIAMRLSRGAGEAVQWIR